MKGSSDKGADLVFVEWVDSHSGRGWQSLDDLKKATEPLYCQSVGWLINKNTSCWTIAPHVAGQKQDATQYSGDITIPKRAIIRTKILRKG